MTATIKAMNNSKMFVTKTYTYTITTLAANSTLGINGNDLGVSTPSGYKPIGFTRIFTGNGHLNVAAFSAAAAGATDVLYVKNTHQSSAVNNATITVEILYAKSGIVN